MTVRFSETHEIPLAQAVQDLRDARRDVLENEEQAGSGCKNRKVLAAMIGVG